MMKRSVFLKNMLGFGLIPAIGSNSVRSKVRANTDQLKEELIQAWDKSERMTLVNIEQMPAEYFTFKYTGEAMSFSEQWRHCVVYTCGQLAGRIGCSNPYENVQLPVQMPKEDVINEIKNMYTFVRESVENLQPDMLYEETEFAGDKMPIWRLFYAMENHIIHHRGQCVVYLRLNGVVPIGYYGW